MPRASHSTALRAQGLNEGSLLSDAETQLEKFNALFKELCRRLTYSQEELAGQHVNAHAAGNHQQLSDVAVNLIARPSSSGFLASGMVCNSNAVLERGHLDDPPPDDEDDEVNQVATNPRSGSTFQTVDKSRSTLKAALSHGMKTISEGSARDPKQPKLKKTTTVAFAHLPATFEINEAWYSTLETEDERFPSETGPLECGIVSLASGESGPLSRLTPPRRFYPRRCLLLPNQPIRVLWDLIGIFFMVQDLVWLPLLMCGAPEGTLSIVLAWCVRLYWSFDFPLNFMTGFVDEDGETVMDSQRAAARYCKTWLLLDLFLVLTDWIEVVLTEAYGMLRGARFGKLIRMARVIRMIRLARLAKLPGILSKLLDNFFAERTLMVMSISKITLVFMGFCHINACIWFKMAADNDSSANWLEQHGFDGSLTEHSYSVSLHWAVTCFIGNIQIEAQNVWERVFSVVVLIVSFVASASFVSAITTSITRLQIINGEEQAHFSMLQNFLRAQGVNRKLSQRITKNAKYAITIQKHKVHEKDVELLGLISEVLRMELHYDMHCRALRIHVLFKFYCSLNPVAMQRICHLGILTVSITSKEMVFRTGKRPDPPSMLFVTQGTLTYAMDNGGSQIALDTAEYACEATLWLKSWVHRGKLIANTDSTVMKLLAEQFQQVMCEEFHPSHVDHPAWYALWFVNRMSEQEPHLVTDLDAGWDQTRIAERHHQFESDEAEARRQGFKTSTQRSLSFRDSTIGAPPSRLTTLGRSSLTFRPTTGFASISMNASMRPKSRFTSLKMITLDPMDHEGSMTSLPLALGHCKSTNSTEVVYP